MNGCSGNTVRDAPLDFKGGGAGSFCKKKNLTHSKVGKKKLDPHIEGKKKLDPHGKKKKKKLVLLGWKKTYPHISLCYRPSNCNLSNLCGLYKSLAPEIASWNLLRLRQKARCAHLSPPADSRAFSARFLGQLSRIESLTKASHT